MTRAPLPDGVGVKMHRADRLLGVSVDQGYCIRMAFLGLGAALIIGVGGSVALHGAPSWGPGRILGLSALYLLWVIGPGAVIVVSAIRHRNSAVLGAVFLPIAAVFSLFAPDIFLHIDESQSAGWAGVAIGYSPFVAVGGTTAVAVIDWLLRSRDPS